MYVSNILRLTIIATWATYVTVNSLPVPDLTIALWGRPVMTCLHHLQGIPVSHYMQLGQLGIWQG